MDKYKILKGKLLNITLVFSFLFGAFSCGHKEVTKPDIIDKEPKDSLALPDTLKVVSFNIEYGMRADRANDYDHFVAWVDSVSPDILALQEVNGFRQRSLEKLAARWGHAYVITNVKADDDFPVAVTSKYPLVSRRKITMNISHGAIFAKLRDADFNIIVTHLWPQGYWHEKSDELGNEYRLFETNLILDSTLRKFPKELNWTFMGDFNSVSRKDYFPENNNLNYLVTDAIDDAGFEDVIHYVNGYKSDQSEENIWDDYYPGRRIDFLFASQPALGNLVNAYPIYDNFTSNYSDHFHAICAEFLLTKKN